MFLEFDKISFSYLEVLALDGISFEVARGEIVGLIGANDAGKTTAILHIIRYLNLKSGKIRMDGVDISKIKNEDFPASYIPDTPVFYEELTLLEHLHFLKALYPDNKLSIDEIIDRLELLDHLHKVKMSQITAEHNANRKRRFLLYHLPLKKIMRFLINAS